MDTNDIIRALEQERDGFYEKAKSIDLTIQIMKQSQAFTSSNGAPVSSNGSKVANTKYAGYREAKSNKAKAFLIVKESGKFLHIRQIREIAASLESGSNKEEIVKAIALAIYALKNDGVLVAYKATDSNMDTFWGSKSWVDDKGKPKPDFMFDPAELSINREEKFEI